MDNLVSTAWLAGHLRDTDLVVVDATMFMPSSGRDAARRICRRAYPRRALPRYRRVVRPSHPAPHMLPPADQFGAAMEELGIGRDDRIVVYDNQPLRTAARGWFMLRHFGAERVAILDGGLQQMARRRAARSKAASRRRARPASTRADAPARSSPSPTIRAGLGVRLIDARGRGAVRRQRARPAARRRRRATSPVRATCRSHRSTMMTAPSSGEEICARHSSPAGADPERAVRRQLRFGRHRQQPDLRRAFARQPRCAALRWKLERMGRRSRHPEGSRARPSGQQPRSRSTIPSRISSASCSTDAGLGAPSPRPVGRAALRAPPPRLGGPLANGPSKQRRVASLAVGHAAAIRSSTSHRRQTPGQPSPSNCSTRRSAWRMLASRATASA